MSMSYDVTDDIMSAVQQAMRLIIAAGGTQAGEYVMIAKANVDLDGDIIFEWDRYYRPPKVT